MSNDLLSDIEVFLTASKMGPSYFGKASCGNSEVVDRLRRGNTVTLVTAERIRDFMRERSKSESAA